MPISKEQLSDLKEKYEKAEKLVEEDSNHDPPTNPFKSHYEARDLLIELQNNLKNLINELSDGDQTEDSDYRVYTYILAFILKDIGRICVWTEELSAGEKYLQSCVDLLEPFKLLPYCINAYLGALNQIGILWSNRENPLKSHEYLDQAERLYIEFKATGLTPLTIYDIFGTKDEIEVGRGSDILEKTHTLTLYYLAQIIGNMGDLHRSAVYCHTTLKRQLEFNDYEPIDWALNAATLSQYFFANHRMTESRHHLAAASYILEQHEGKMMKPEMTEDERGAVQEIYNHRSADVWRCWAKYGLNLLIESKNRLMDDASGQEDDKDAGKCAKEFQTLQIADKPSESCKFNTIDVTAYEQSITDNYLLMFDDAKPVFLAVQNWLNKAKEYYSAESEASEYARIVQDLASSYKYLAFYDFDESNQCKLHKRRADLSEDLLNVLNETYYLGICRELWFELGSAYSTMLDIKLDAFEKIKIQENPSPHVLNKINLLCNKSIKKFQSFVQSYANKDTKELERNLSDEEMEPIMFAYFQIARLYYKIITPDRAMQIENVQQSLRYYSLFVRQCESNKKICDNMRAEYGVCKEMISLLPLKIKKISGEINSDGTTNATITC